MAARAKRAAAAAATFLPGRLRAPADGRAGVLLVACGSFSPVTLMHLRMFEQARDHLEHAATPLSVVGGVASPVHDAYGKAGLAPGAHRLEMLRRALESSAWVSAGRWELEQPGWSRAADALAFYEGEAAEAVGAPVRALLLCGADLLRSVVEDLDVWDDADREAIFGRHGVACLDRTGDDAAAMLREHPMLRPYAENIHLVPQTVVNDISSTLVRGLAASGRSVRYLVPDAVADYMAEHGLYRDDGRGREEKGEEDDEQRPKQ